MRDHYRILGVGPKADLDAIRAAYRQLVRQKHPDLAATPADHADFAALTEAYRVLADPAARRQYDAKRIFLLAPPIRRLLDAFENPRVRGRLAETLLRGARALFQPKNRPQRIDGEDILVNKLISFQQSYTGGDILVEYERQIRCMTCQGCGRHHPKECPLCHGQGQMVFPGAGPMRKLCPRCNGLGLIGKTPCRTCLGSGRHREAATKHLRVPPGAKAGLKLRAQGQGDQGWRGGRDGDLIVCLAVEGALDFIRRDLDLYTEKVIPLQTAVRGGKAAVVMPDKSAIEIDIPRGSPPGRELRIAGRGFRSPPGGKKGDLIVRLDVYMPGDLDDHVYQLGLAWLEAVETGPPDRAAGIAAELETIMEGRTP